MLKLYYAPRTRAARILWLLEELGLPYQLESVEFLPTSDTFFQQKTPTGKLPTIEDGDVVMCESGAIVEYILERYGQGRLAPAAGTPERAKFLQWLHYAESTAFPPLGIVVWLTRYRAEAGAGADDALLADARGRAASGLEFLERELGAGPYLLGEAFSAADVMMGFTLIAARLLGVLDARFPVLGAYLDRLQQRPALKKILATTA
jgi:glutathione S-transferase